VTSFRSSSLGATWSRRCPQAAQNWAPARTSAPQAGQVETSGVPHEGQNRAPSSIAERQEGQDATVVLTGRE
jgi:hypothetical protein